MIDAPNIGLFSIDPGKIVDFSGKKPADIFNQSILPRVNSFLDLLGSDPGGMEEADQRRQQELSYRTEESLFAQQQDDEFLSGLRERRAAMPEQGEEDYGISPMGDYGSPAPAPAQAPTDSSIPESSTQPQGANAPPMSRPTKNVVDFIKHFEAGGAKEGFYPKAYWDYGQWSIGYGTRAKKGEVIDRGEAERRLSGELSKHRSRVEALNKKHNYRFTKNELDALTSFDYNTGSLEQLTANGKRDKTAIAKKILEHNKAGGKRLPGLVTRRTAEHKLFTQGY